MLQPNLQSGSTLHRLDSFMPLVNVVLTACNLVLPPITQLFVKFEKWDEEETKLQLNTSRLYFAKILNLLVSDLPCNVRREGG